MLKRAVRAVLRPLPQWSPIATESLSNLVTASLHGNGQSLDVTADHTVASLKPLVIATRTEAGDRPVLEYRDTASGERLGALELVRATDITEQVRGIGFYYVAHGAHHCLSWPQRPWHAWLQNRAMRKNQAPGRLSMSPASVQQLMIAYLPPRPVVLVSVASSEHRNMFPMDLIGPLTRSGYFSLALRSTNVSASVMRESKRVALSHIPAALKDSVYALSEHHKRAPDDWQALPFALRESREFGLPVVASALRIQELAIEHAQEIGSHIFFLARVLSDESVQGGQQLHHTAGFHQVYRRHQGRPFTAI